MSLLLLTPFDRAEATDYVALHMYQVVHYSDVIVIGTVTDGERAIVHVDQTLKGAPPRSIRLVEYLNGMTSPATQRTLITGTQELMFLTAKEGEFTPIQTQHGRWPMRNGRVQAPGHIAQLGLQDFRKTIARLVGLQATAVMGGGRAIDAYVEGLKSTDRHVRLWAAHTAYQQVDQPSPRLVDAYLKLWATRDGEMRGSTANAVIKWRLRAAAPMLAETLREAKNWGDRATAARALGGTRNMSFLPLLREMARTDESEKVRGYAYEGLTLLLGGDSLPDLQNGAKDASVFVRQSVAGHAFNMANESSNRELRERVRTFLQALIGDRAAPVELQHWIRQLGDR